VKEQCASEQNETATLADGDFSIASHLIQGTKVVNVSIAHTKYDILTHNG